ncbi:MAG: LexA regulated protein [Oceanospirillaceae bacterium]|nr:LexA regulated protein [Oceanospirillaceae bacterium]MBT10767.1 LexA regulated protein [Oceanospirillaceae bacterium]|tara:strand:+ start:186617 stop:186886 length:270 start_codon:yes stop_codon:yes gene_type:complete
MSIQPEDRTTIDMFSATKRGRPRSNPYDRNQQLRINKRVQRQRDKARGLARLEVKLDAGVIDRMDDVCEELGLTRAEVMELALKQWLHL